MGVSPGVRGVVSRVHFREFIDGTICIAKCVKLVSSGLLPSGTLCYLASLQRLYNTLDKFCSPLVVNDDSRSFLQAPMYSSGIVDPGFRSYFLSPLECDGLSLYWVRQIARKVWVVPE